MGRIRATTRTWLDLLLERFPVDGAAKDDNAASRGADITLLSISDEVLAAFDKHQVDQHECRDEQARFQISRRRCRDTRLAMS